MRADRFQTTLKAPCSVSGRGYWTGQVNTLTFVPAPADTGIRFRRMDLEGHPSVSAVAENRHSMPLRTRLAHGRAEVDMVEHVLAAMHGMRVDNAIVLCTASEMPAMDGSSLAFALAVESAGLIELPTERRTLVIDRAIRVGDERQWVLAEPVCDRHHTDSLEVEYQLDFGSDSAIAKATKSIRLTPATFFSEVAAARTFIGIETARMLQSRGMARHVTEQDLLVFDDLGPVNNALRYPDECARHKLLDLIGDLALTGLNLVGRITASRGGHQLNGEMANALRQMAHESAMKPRFSSRYTA